MLQEHQARPGRLELQGLVQHAPLVCIASKFEHASLAPAKHVGGRFATQARGDVA